MIKSLKVFLVGMPSCGKSTLGKIVSEKTNLKMIDLDEEIAKLENQSIKKIFELKGESYFRGIENKILNKIIKKNKSFIMATGGGTPCFKNNIDLINKSGVSIYIYTSIDKLEKRLTDDTKRPLIKTDFIKKEFVNELYNKRKVYYKKSKFILSENKDQVEEIISIIDKLKT